MDADLFDPDRPWLTGQPRLERWDAGCAALRQQLERWLREYCALLGCRHLTAADPGHDRFLRRLWGCWGYHWHAAVQEQGGPVDGWAVAEQLRAGVGSLGQGHLGGDPLRDVVLAEAVLQRDNAATRRFTQEYREFVCGLIARAHASAADFSDWWSELIDRLAGYTRPPGKLERYAGRCGLRNWLGTVIRRFVYDRYRHRPAAEHATDPADLTAQGGTASPEEELITGECLRASLELVRVALEDLDPEDRLLLCMSFVDGLSGRDAARVLGIDPGTVSRRKARALTALGAALDGRPAGKRPENAELVRHLLGGNGRRTFGGALLEALRQVAPSGAW
jgi:RNA polymerase sigma-70 factor (ECF subfamily)